MGLNGTRSQKVLSILEQSEKSNEEMITEMIKKMESWDD
jgi:hypothetical protein